MSETEIMPLTENSKLYSSNAIGGATLFGGPLAAGYMIGENFKALGKPEAGKNALMIGIGATILIFVIAFTLPEDMFDKTPAYLIPIIYIGITRGIVEWKQGEALRFYKKNEEVFFSVWRAVGIGLVSILILVTGMLVFAFFTVEEVYDRYEAERIIFSKNEQETFTFYDHWNQKADDQKTDENLLQELAIIIPKWNENIAIIERINQWENLPPELATQNESLLKYAQLRLEVLELFKKTLEEQDMTYLDQIEELHQKIDEIVKKLN